MVNVKIDCDRDRVQILFSFQIVDEGMEQVLARQSNATNLLDELELLCFDEKVKNDIFALPDTTGDCDIYIRVLFHHLQVRLDKFIGFVNKSVRQINSQHCL